MTDKQEAQGDALTPAALAAMRELGWTEAQIEAQRQAAERIRAAGGFKNWVAMCEAARIQSEARGYTVPPENFRVRDERGTITEQLAAIAAEPDNGAPPALWAFWFAAELRERNPGMDSAARTVAEGQIMRAFEAHADALPLRQAPSGLLWPKGQPLPPGWREGLYMTKAELRAWAKECAPDFLGSALLAEPQPAPAEQPASGAGPGEARAVNDWTPERIEEMRQTFQRYKAMPLCRNFAARTAKHYGISTQRMYALIGPVPKGTPSAFDVVPRTFAAPKVKAKTRKAR